MTEIPVYWFSELENFKFYSDSLLFLWKGLFKLDCCSLVENEKLVELCGFAKIVDAVYLVCVPPIGVFETSRYIFRLSGDTLPHDSLIRSDHLQIIVCVAYAACHGPARLDFSVFNGHLEMATALMLSTVSKFCFGGTTLERVSKLKT